MNRKEIRTAAVNLRLAAAVYALKMVRTSDADRYQDLGIRMTEMLLERFVSEPVKVEFERQVLEVVLSDEIEFFCPELIKIAFRITGSVSVR